MSSACLFLFFYLNQMSHPTMFPTSHMRTKRTRNQTKIWYIIVPYGHVLVPLCVPLWICSWLIFRNLLLLIHKSVHFIFFLFFFCFLLCFPDLFVLSTSFFLELNIFLYFLSPPHCIIMTQYVFQSFLSLGYHAKNIRILWMLIFSGVDWRASLGIGFFQIVLCWRIIQTNNIIMQNFALQTLSVSNNFWKMIHSVHVWRLSDWEFILHVYSFCAGLLEEIHA